MDRVTDGLSLSTQQMQEFVSSVAVMAIAHFAGRGHRFTAHDVTRRLRNMWVEHEHIRDVVAELTASGLLKRELKTLENGDSVWVYSESNQKTSAVAPVVANRISMVSAPLDPPLDHVSSTTPQVKASLRRVVYPVNEDVRGTICIPAAVIRDVLGLTWGESCYVTHKDGLRLSRNPLKGIFYDVNYTVDAYHNVRVTQNTLLRAGFKNGPYQIEVEYEDTKARVFIRQKP